MRNREKVLGLIRCHKGHEQMMALPRMFISLTDGVVLPALLLSQLLYWSDRAASPEGWVYKSRLEWANELGTSPRAIDRARARLRALGLIEEAHHLANNRRVLHLKIDMSRLCSALREMASEDGTALPGPKESVSTSQPAQDPVTTVPIRRRESRSPSPSNETTCRSRSHLFPIRPGTAPGCMPALHRDRLLARIRSRLAIKNGTQEATSAAVYGGPVSCRSNVTRQEERDDWNRRIGLPHEGNSTLPSGEARASPKEKFALSQSRDSITETTAEISTETSTNKMNEAHQGKEERDTGRNDTDRGRCWRRLADPISLGLRRSFQMAARR